MLLIVGGLSMLSLPISEYPDVVPPTVVVATGYPGASAQVVANTVATPIEQEVNGTEGMLYMSSQS
ncbi:MAG: efflux RND transporter permease subunit, partial [Paracraurococcus sp.]